MIGYKAQKAAAAEHCGDVFNGTPIAENTARAIKATNQAFMAGANWRGQKDAWKIKMLKGRIKTLTERLENEHSNNRSGRTENRRGG